MNCAPASLGHELLSRFTPKHSRPSLIVFEYKNIFRLSIPHTRHAGVLFRKHKIKKGIQFPFLFCAPRGIEPRLQAPQACVLSIERRGRVYNTSQYSRYLLFRQVVIKTAVKRNQCISSHSLAFPLHFFVIPPPQF